MGLQLLTFPAPAGLLDLGTVVEMREVPYGRVRELMAGPGPLSGPERLFAEVLHIDGQPLGIDRLMTQLPGRYMRAVSDGLAMVVRMHDLQLAQPEGGEPAPGAGDQSRPGEDPAGGNA